VSGDDSSNATGAGCNVADLCQVGWHVCASASDVVQHTAGTPSADANACVASAVAGSTDYFTTRQSGNGNGNCVAIGFNDTFGCGTLGATPVATSCPPLTRFSNNLCSSLGAPWSCATGPVSPADVNEAHNITKSGPANGGVMCCRD
jgi:hypothetical protein